MKLKANNEGRCRFKVDVEDQDDGTYLVEYTIFPDLSFFSFTEMNHDPWFDDYTLSVCLRGAHIKGSPFAVKSHKNTREQKR